VKKIAILVVVLIIPSVAYLLLQTGKNNYKKLEIFGPKEPVEKTVSGKVVVDTLYHTVGGFSLYDTDSALVNEKIVDGKIYVVDFFFSTCTTICPKMSNQLMRVQHTYGEDKDVAVLSFTVDTRLSIKRKRASGIFLQGRKSRFTLWRKTLIS
jgi:protein SCO1/2